VLLSVSLQSVLFDSAAPVAELMFKRSLAILLWPSSCDCCLSGGFSCDLYAKSSSAAPVFSDVKVRSTFTLLSLVWQRLWLFVPLPLLIQEVNIPF